MFQSFRLVQLMRERGISQSELARRIGVSATTIWKLTSGEPMQGTKYLHQIARELGTTPAFLMGETDDAREGAVPAPSPATLKEQLNLAAVREIDLTFGMGATYLDIPVTETVRHFSRDWIRQYTYADPEHLFFAQGIGDSMSPTILDRDLLLIDASQKIINIHDKIWVVAYANCGAVRRIRPKADGTVEMLCDNELVPNDLAADGEMTVLGRVVASVRKH